MVLEETQKSPGNRSDHEFLVGIGALLETGLQVAFFYILAKNLSSFAAVLKLDGKLNLKVKNELHGGGNFTCSLWTVAWLRIADF